MLWRFLAVERAHAFTVFSTDKGDKFFTNVTDGKDVAGREGDICLFIDSRSCKLLDYIVGYSLH